MNFMRAVTIAIALALTMTGVSARAQEGPNEVGTVEVGPPDFSGLAMMGFNLCLDSYQGLPLPGHGDHVLILWPCHGRENQHVVLANGVLYLGDGRAHRIEIMSPGARCDDYNVRSARRAYGLGICRAPDLIVQRRIDYDAGRAFIGSDAPAEMTGPLPGDPLVVRRLGQGEEPRLRWEYERASRQLRVAGTELCLTPPSQDLTAGAPLYLDYCAQPFRLVREDGADGPGRTQIEFVEVFRRQTN